MCRTPIYTSGNPMKFNNCRGIMPLNTVYKTLTSIISKRVASYVNERIGEYQYGFKKERAIIDTLHIYGTTNGEML